MPRYQYIRTKEDIQFLVLYSLQLLPQAVTFEDIVDLVTMCDDGFSWFELREAFDELIRNDLLTIDSDGAEPRYQIGERGREVSAAFVGRLPHSVRRLAQESALRVVRRIHRDAVITAETYVAGPADYPVTLGLEELFTLSLHAVSEEQAAIMTRNFKNHAEEIYLNIVKALTKDYDED